MTVDQALEWEPELEAAISERPIRRSERWAPLRAAARALSEVFLGTIDERDGRLDDMAIGTGIWVGDVALFIPMQEVEDAGGHVFTDLAGRRVLAYIDPTSRTLFAQYTGANEARWEGRELVLDNGRRIRAAVLYEEGEKLQTERPLQVFTRWYGFALTFPATEILND